jgi:hypothetical protein
MPKATKVPAASIWKEVQQLNPWLAGDEGRDALGEVLPPKWRLVSAEQQQVAGALYVDVLGKATSGEMVVIEAQLGQSNHDHLGKLVTYAAIYQAGAAVWIVGEARPEHQQAINALNQGGLAEFFLIKLDAVRVADSPPAPLLTLIAGPTADLQTAGKVKAALKSQDTRRLEFWEALLPEAAIQVDPKFAAKKARATTRMGIPTDRVAVRYVVGLQQHTTSVELVVLAGRKGKYGDASVVMSEIKTSAAAIQQVVGKQSLDWISSSSRARLRIALAGGGYDDPESWPAVRSRVIASLARLIQATGPVLKSLRSRAVAHPGSEAVAGAEEEEEEDEA